MLKVAAEVVLSLEVALIDGSDERQLIHVLKNRPSLVVHDSTVGQPIAQTENRLERNALRDVATREVEFFTTHEIDRIARSKRAVRIDGYLCPDHPDQDAAICVVSDAPRNAHRSRTTASSYE